jgi:hypothetical protein
MAAASQAGALVGVLGATARLHLGTGLLLAAGATLSG